MRRRAAALVVAALVLGALVLPWRPPTLCLLRNLTGIPCPFCGGTTAMVQLGRGDLEAALYASPLVVLGAPLWVSWPRLRPAVERWSQQRWSERGWSERGVRRALLAGGAVALVLSEAWQLHRFA